MQVTRKQAAACSVANGLVYVSHLLSLLPECANVRGGLLNSLKAQINKLRMQIK